MPLLILSYMYIDNIMNLFLQNLDRRYLNIENFILINVHKCVQRDGVQNIVIKHMYNNNKMDKIYVLSLLILENKQHNTYYMYVHQHQGSLVCKGFPLHRNITQHAHRT